MKSAELKNINRLAYTKQDNFSHTLENSPEKAFFTQPYPHWNSGEKFGSANERRFLCIQKHQPVNTKVRFPLSFCAVMSKHSEKLPCRFCFLPMCNLSSEARRFLEHVSFRFAMEIFVSFLKRHQLSPYVWFRG